MIPFLKDGVFGSHPSRKHRIRMCGLEHNRQLPDIHMSSSKLRNLSVLNRVMRLVNYEMFISQGFRSGKNPRDLLKGYF